MSPTQQKVFGAVLGSLTLATVVIAWMATHVTAEPTCYSRGHIVKCSAEEKAEFARFEANGGVYVEPGTTAPATTIGDDLNTRVVCRDWMRVSKDVDTGMVNYAELRPRLQAVYTRAKFNKTIEPVLRQMLQAVGDTPDAAKLSASVDKLAVACRKAGQ